VIQSGARSVRVALAFRALTTDAVGTLLAPAEPVATTYVRAAAARGVATDASTVAAVLADVARRPPAGQVGDGRAYWRAIVARAIGTDDPHVFEALYAHYGGAGAWTVADGARAAIRSLREAGVRVAVVSNFDDRLPMVIAALALEVDAVVCSGEVGTEKPDPHIFLAACACLGVHPSEAVHVGDHPDDDVAGARAAGLAAWQFGSDVAGWPEIAARILGTP
jgi:REG-2-like HAD superfamily hydrolase